MRRMERIQNSANDPNCYVPNNLDGMDTVQYLLSLSISELKDLLRSINHNKLSVIRIIKDVLNAKGYRFE